MANPIPPGGITLQIKQSSEVTVKGIRYAFTVDVDPSIANKRWDKLVKNHIEYLLTVSDRKSFESITSTFKKNDVPNPQDPFSLEKSEVTYVTTNGKHKKIDAKATYLNKPFPKQTQDKVNKFWEATQHTLQEITSGASQPAQPAPQPANLNPAPPAPAPGVQGNPAPPAPAPAVQGNPAPPAPAPGVQGNPAPPANPVPPVRAPSPAPTIVTPYKNRAKRMEKKRLKVELALADQLSKMSNPKYKGGDVASIASRLKTEYLSHIKNNTNAYAKEPSKFQEIMDNLINADKKDQTRLKTACNALHSTKIGARLGGYTNINEQQLDDIFTRPSSDLSLEEKQDLIKIHNLYVTNDGLLNTSSFLKTFVTIHNPKSDPDMFEVVVVNDAKREELFPLSSNSTRLPKNEKNCVFLYADAHGSYHSIPRVVETLTPNILSARPLVQAQGASKSAILENLMDLYDSYTEQSIYEYVLGQNPFQNQNLETTYKDAFEALKLFIYKRDIKDAADQSAIDRINADANYGWTKLNAMDAYALAVLLKKQRDNILNLADDKDFQII